MMNKQMQNPYLYLEKKEYATTWVNGGKIPIKLASCYRKDERSGIYTPDENVIDDSSDGLHPDSREFAIKSLTSGECMHGLAIIDGNSIKGCGYDTITMPKSWTSQVPGNFKTITYEDGYILSFCREKSKILGNRLGKKICVQINDIFKLKKCIDEQMNCIGEYQRCKYTKTHQRNHFLKSKDDEWQQEYRIFWNTTSYTEQVLINIPKNTARICRI